MMGASTKPFLSVTRRSDRIDLGLPIQVIGDDSDGNTFVEDSHTLVLSRHGAKILLSRSLVPEQELTISCATTGKEAVVRVVGQMGKMDGGLAYGIMLLDPEFNLWDIEFPPLSESEDAAGRALLECMHCRGREVTYLDEIEIEILATTHRLSRPCKRCGGTSLWHAVEEPDPAGGAAPTSDKNGGGGDGPRARPNLGQGIPLPLLQEPPAVPALPSTSTRAEERVDPTRNLGLRVMACVRHPQFGDEVVTTEQLSRAGVTFKSPRHYDRTLPLHMAVPYVRGSVNIFAPVQVETKAFLPEERVSRYTVSYIPVHRGWPKP